MKLACAAAATLAAVMIVWLLAEPSSHADTIVLKNGSKIHGKALKQDGAVIVDFGAAGKLTLRESDVREIIPNDRNDFTRDDAVPVPAATSRPVVVTIKEDRARYGSGKYVGISSESSDDRVLVLATAGGGEIRILREDIASIAEAGEKDAPTRVVPAVDATTISTTHKITLTNGRELRGDLIETPENEPALLRIGDYGLMEIRRGKIATIEKIDGKIDLPKPSVPDTAEPADSDVDEIKREIRDEIIRELLDRLIDRHLGDAVRKSADALQLSSIAAEVPAETAQMIHIHVSELGRQRTQNRVRAETALRAHGKDALPYLLPAVSHPFWLTRRAAQRLIRDAGDIRGVPMAIDALDDTDFHVRKLAHEALTRILGSTEGIAYDADAPKSARRHAVERYRQLWHEIVRYQLEDIAPQA